MFHADLPTVFAVNQAKAVAWFAKLVVLIRSVGFKVRHFVVRSISIAPGTGQIQYMGVNREMFLNGVN